MTSLDFSYGTSVALPLISLTNLDLKIRTSACLIGSYCSNRKISLPIKLSISCLSDASNGRSDIVIRPFFRSFFRDLLRRPRLRDPPRYLSRPLYIRPIHDWPYWWPSVSSSSLLKRALNSCCCDLWACIAVFVEDRSWAQTSSYVSVGLESSYVSVGLESSYMSVGLESSYASIDWSRRLRSVWSIKLKFWHSEAPR